MGFTRTSFRPSKRQLKEQIEWFSFSNPLLELEHELAISKRVSGHAPAQSLKHESQSLWSSLEAGRVHLGNPDRECVGKGALGSQKQELPAVGQPAVSDHLADILLAMSGTVFHAVGENHRQNRGIATLSMSAQGMNQMGHGIVERSAATRFVLSREQRRDVTERNSVMNQRNIVIEERQGEARVAGECFLLIRPAGLSSGG